MNDVAKEVLWESLVEVKPGDDDELFDSKECKGGYLKVYVMALNAEEATSKICSALEDYGTKIVALSDLFPSRADIQGLGEWKGVYFGNLHTFMNE
jgi:hypothetical protein